LVLLTNVDDLLQGIIYQGFRSSKLVTNVINCVFKNPAQGFPYFY